MADQRLSVTGWLVAEVELVSEIWSGSRSRGGRLFLFRTSGDWTLLSVEHSTRWDENDRPQEGGAFITATSYPDLDAVKAALECGSRYEDWRKLVRAGAENSPELLALWTPVQIDIDLEKSSVHRRELGVHGGGRAIEGWQEGALDLAVERLQDIGFAVLDASADPARIFRRRLIWDWNPIVGAAAIAKYGYRADVVVAIDGAGEIYVRTPDGSFDPGTPRRYPSRPLTQQEGRLAEELYRRRRSDQLRRLDDDMGGPCR